MTALSSEILRDRLSRSDLEERLVVSPLLEPNEQLRDNQSSIDVRLGFQFALVTPSSHTAVDEFSEDWNPSRGSTLSTLYRKRYVSLGDHISVHPHQFVLAETFEYIRLPYDIMAYVVGRSGWGRLGLIVATAIGVHPGFAGCLVLELRNLGETPLCLYPGQSIAQLFFHSVQISKDREDGIGQYSGSVDILPQKLSPDKTYDKLHKLRAERQETDS